MTHHNPDCTGCPICSEAMAWILANRTMPYHLRDLALKVHAELRTAVPPAPAFLERLRQRHTTAQPPKEPSISPARTGLRAASDSVPRAINLCASIRAARGGAR